MPWADVITDQPGACLGSQAWAKHGVTRLHTKSEVRVKCNTSMHKAITIWKEVSLHYVFLFFFLLSEEKILPEFQNKWDDVCQLPWKLQGHQPNLWRLSSLSGSKFHQPIDIQAAWHLLVVLWAQHST